jgi:hypothetical protein
MSTIPAWIRLAKPPGIRCLPQATAVHLTQVFNQRGEGVVVRGATATISKEDRQPHLSADDAFTLLKDALARYRDVHTSIRQRSSSFTKAHASTPRNNRTPASPRLTKSNKSIRSSVSAREGLYPPLRGTMLSLDERNCVPYTRGSVSFFETYPGLYVPGPLLIRSELTQETQRGFAREVIEPHYSFCM